MDWTALSEAAIWMPMAASLVAGAAIGFERELKAKAAGVRTHALVCCSSAILMMAAARQADWVFDALPGTAVVADPTRMAHGILTGIGFLGAGVIFRQGNSVTGLTTAASIWMTASLGVLFGAGLVVLATAGTVMALAVLVVFRLFHLAVPDRIEMAVEVAGRTPLDPGAVGEVLARHAARMGPVAWTRDLRDGNGVEVSARVWLAGAADAARLDAALAALAGVERIALTPVAEVDRAV